MLKCETCLTYRKSDTLFTKCGKCKRAMKHVGFRAELLSLLAQIARNTMGGG